MNIELTNKEEKLTKYCQDFCPIYYSIENYNSRHYIKISCSTQMCNNIQEDYILNLRNELK